jgi:defect-in-organelle-trafficking protein DotC
MANRTALLAGAAALAVSLAFGCALAQRTPTSSRLPPEPTFDQIDGNVPDLANPLNQPVTGARIDPLVGGTEPPPSLESLQAARPGDEPGDGLEAGRSDVLRTAALTYGAQGGLAARGFALNEMLRRMEAQLDATYDFRALVLPAGSGGQTLMRPPVVSAAQMAFALGDGGQVARESNCVYQVTRAATLSSAPPNWRAYLVRSWSRPRRPSDAALPRTRQEAAFWNRFVAEGWAQGERQAVDIFLADLGRLERDIVGMGRYRVLLRAGLVEPPRIAFENRAAQGGRESLHIGDRTVRITDQPGLQANPRRWQPAAGCPR